MPIWTFDLPDDAQPILVLDLSTLSVVTAPGTGSAITVEADESLTPLLDVTADGAEVVACDFSTGMVAEGKRRHPEIAFVAGDATALPFADESFDVVTISYGLRNVQDTARALAEMHRVTVPGGRIVIAEFSTPVSRVFRRMYRFYLGSALPAAARLVSSNTQAYDYLGESILAWPDQRELAGLMHEAGWRGVGYKNLSGGIVAVHRATRGAQTAQAES